MFRVQGREQPVISYVGEAGVGTIRDKNIGAFNEKVES